MDLPVWISLAAVMLVSAQANPTDKGPQKFSDTPTSNPEKEALQEKKQSKREPSYQEVILYLTPSQIKAFESGKYEPQVASQLKAMQERGELGRAQQADQHRYAASEQLTQYNHNSKYEIQSSGQGQKEVEQLLQLDLSPLNKQLNEQMQNHYNTRMQANQKEVKINEAKKQQQIQSQGDEQFKLEKEKDNKQVSENRAVSQLEQQKREKYFELAVPLHFIPQALTYQQQQQQIPNGVPQLQLEPHFVASPTPQQLPAIENQLKHLSSNNQQGKAAWLPNNYAYLYFYPNSKPVNHEHFQLLYPEGQLSKELLIQEQSPKFDILPQTPKESVFQFHHPKFQLVPYEYNLQNKLEAQHILQSQLEDHHLDAHRLEGHKLETHQLEDINTHNLDASKLKDYQHEHVDIQQLLTQKELEPHYQHKLENINLETPKYELPKTGNINLELPKYEFFKPEKHISELPKYEISNPKKLISELPQYEFLNLEKLVSKPPQYQLSKPEKDAFELPKYELPKPEKLISEPPKYEPQELKLKIIPHTAALKAQLSKEIKVDLKELSVHRQQEMKEVFEAQKLKAKIETEEKEAQRLDAQLKEEELKAEVFKAEQMQDELIKQEQMKDELFKIEETNDNLYKNEPFKEQIYENQQKYEYQDLAYLRELQPKKTQMYSILNPLFQGQSIVESLQQQKETFPHRNVNLETGFKPLQYAPKFNSEKYEREVEKIVRKNEAAKQKALAKAAAIANEPPQIIHREEKIVTVIKKPMEVVKQVEVPIPTPVMVPVPTPIEVKVPQPFPVQMEIIGHYPIRILKMENDEDEKPVPVIKNIFSQVEKPYYAENVVPAELKREAPIKIPLRRPIKYKVIKHVWKRS